jgi:hypothetical protein
MYLLTVDSSMKYFVAPQQRKENQFLRFRDNTRIFYIVYRVGPQQYKGKALLLFRSIIGYANTPQYCTYIAYRVKCYSQW